MSVSFEAMPGLCFFVRVTHVHGVTRMHPCHKEPAPTHHHTLSPGV